VQAWDEQLGDAPAVPVYRITQQSAVSTVNSSTSAGSSGSATRATVVNPAQDAAAKVVANSDKYKSKPHKVAVLRLRDTGPLLQVTAVRCALMNYQ
jgi:cell wall-associated NlpC family hydrolase